MTANRAPCHFHPHNDGKGFVCTACLYLVEANGGGQGRRLQGCTDNSGTSLNGSISSAGPKMFDNSSYFNWKVMRLSRTS